MIIAGIEIDESAAVAYMRKEWAEGRPVAAQWIRDMFWPQLAAAPHCDREWIAAEAQRRLCQWYRQRGVCRYDQASGRWVPA
jgi:hypothetical protein